MPYAQIIDMPGAGVSDYEQAFALIHPDGEWPAGQLDHIAGPTPDGFRVIDVWEDRSAFERFEQDVLAPLGLNGLPRLEFPVHRRYAAVSAKEVHLAGLPGERADARGQSDRRR